ncbi:MAG: hypothetical protein OXC01_01365 [Immundisolibacterales bacterium]|nr:hypothetical protein [Immundisolibacterales bacterium]
MVGTALPPPASRRRISVTSVAVFGLGALVAIAAGAVLWLGLGSAAESTRRLIHERSDTVLDSLEQELGSRLEPITEQARWIAALVEDGKLDLADPAGLDAFMFGALAATPQVAGIGFFRPDGTGRVWYRDARVAISEDRSQDPNLRQWMQAGTQATTTAWRDPIWIDTLGKAAVLHDSPLRRGGRFVGMLGQVVLTEELSRDLTGNVAPNTVPFVLHRDRDVLAHPQLVHWSPLGTGESRPLAVIDEVGDPVLAALGTNATREGRWLIRSAPGIDVSWVVLDDVWHLVLQRRMPRYGEWTVGVHVNVEANEDRTVQHMVQAAAAGVAVLVVAVVLAVLVGRRISRPVRAIAAAARVVEGNRLDEVRRLRPSWIREMDDANRSFNRMVEGLRERQLIRRTLGRYVPERVASELLSAGGRIEPTEVRATVLFCDLVGFTSLTETLGPTGIVAVLNEWFSRMTEVLERRGGTVIQFQGDALLATFNVPVADPDHARQAVRAALDMLAATRRLTAGGRELECRIGVGTGTVVAAAVGASGRLSYTVYGDAVNLAARLESLNRDHGTSNLLCGETAADAEDLPVEPVGTTTVRGQSVPTRLFTVRERETGRPPEDDSEGTDEERRSGAG